MNCKVVIDPADPERKVCPVCGQDYRGPRPPEQIKLTCGRLSTGGPGVRLTLELTPRPRPREGEDETAFERRINDLERADQRALTFDRRPCVHRREELGQVATIPCGRCFDKRSPVEVRQCDLVGPCVVRLIANTSEQLVDGVHPTNCLDCAKWELPPGVAEPIPEPRRRRRRPSMPTATADQPTESPIPRPEAAQPEGVRDGTLSQ